MYICEFFCGTSGGCLFVNCLVAGFVLLHQGWLVSLHVYVCGGCFLCIWWCMFGAWPLGIFLVGVHKVSC